MSEVKTVTVRNDELQVALTGMQRMVAELLQQKTSPHLMMRLRRMMRAAASVVEDAEQERLRLIKLYAKLDEKGEVVNEPAEQGARKAVFETPEKQQEFGAAFQALMAVTSEQPEQLEENDFQWVTTSGEKRQAECLGETLLMLGPLLEE